LARSDAARLGRLRLEDRTRACAGPERQGDLGELVDRRSQPDQDQACRNGDGARNDQRISEVELVDRNPKADSDNAGRRKQDTQYKQDHRHSCTPDPPGHSYFYGY
jgi:hypothetical protein